MKKLFFLSLILILCVACQESLEDRCTRECKEYTTKKCPAPIDEFTTLDSLTFEPSTHTLCYFYTMKGAADTPANINATTAREALVEQVKNATSLKAYKDEGYNFRYAYHSQSDPSLLLFSTLITEKDYR